MLALRSFCIAGSATLTTVLLMNAMLEAMTMAARIHGAARRVQTAVEAVARTTPSSHGSCVVNALTGNPLDLYRSRRHRLSAEIETKGRMAMPGDPHVYLERLMWEAILFNLSRVRKFPRCPR